MSSERTNQEILNKLERMEQRIKFAIFLVWLTFMVMSFFMLAATLTAVEHA